MAIEIELNEFFVNANGEPVMDCDGYQFADFFENDGYARAYEARNAQEADAILRATYKGRDALGVGVVWCAEERF